MLITFSPIRSDAEPLTVSVTGDVLTINGEAFDFRPLPDGGTLPADAITSDRIVGDVSRVSGRIVLTLLLPHGPNPPEEMAFPAPITVTANGAVAVPAMPALEATDA